MLVMHSRGAALECSIGHALLKFLIGRAAARGRVHEDISSTLKVKLLRFIVQQGLFGSICLDQTPALF